MDRPTSEYLTTKELADLLRIKERKVYDLAANDEVPCVRAVGKLLFPRQDILNWMAQSRSGPQIQANPLPAIFVGSHDPLLDWALRDSASGVAAFFDGSHDGLDRMMNRQATACSLHIHQEDGGWNIDATRSVAANQPVVLVEFARRLRGLIVAQGNPLGLHSIRDLAGRRFAHRQQSAASQRLFQDLASQVGLETDKLDGPATPARTEDDVARVVAEGKADAAFGLSSAAQQMRLDFMPIIEERFDILVWRQAWFEPPFQQLLSFFNSAPFKIRAAEMGGYDLTHLGQVHFNGKV